MCVYLMFHLNVYFKFLTKFKDAYSFICVCMHYSENCEALYDVKHNFVIIILIIHMGIRSNFTYAYGH